MSGRTRRRPALAVMLGALVLVQGCGGGAWTRVEPRPNGAWPARQRAQVWRGGRPVVWHAVRVSGDSLSGVPFVQPPSCDSCRVAIALAEVDSVCAGAPDAGARETAFLIGLGLLVAWFTWCVSGGCNFRMA